jgi:hypothetical protein
VAALTAMNDCEASVLPGSILAEANDGLSDAYGLVKFRMHQSEITKLLSLCETDPPLGLRIFREAMDRGNVSAKLVAMNSAFYLTLHKQLEAEDFQRIVSHLPPDGTARPDSAADKDGQAIVSDLRRVAQRAVSDLTVIEDVGHAASYEVLPEGLPKPPPDGRPARVQTRQSRVSGFDEPVLLVRWSDAEVAYKWWQAVAKQGHWDKEKQRFVIPSGATSAAKSENTKH